MKRWNYSARKSTNYVLNVVKRSRNTSL